MMKFLLLPSFAKINQEKISAIAKKIKCETFKKIVTLGIFFLSLFTLAVLAQEDNNPCTPASTPELSGLSDTFTSNLPIVLINSYNKIIPNEYRIPGFMEIKNNPQGRNFLNQNNEFEGRISIEIRGSSSAYFDKKSYGFETQKENGENRNVSLLGLPEENDWILYGPYSDKSLLRNAITFYLARTMGRYASRIIFCELIVNGDYQGLYILMEKIKRDKNRVEIAPLNPENQSGYDVTGGYIIKVDKKEGDFRGWTSYPDSPHFTWNPIYFQYVYPDHEIILPQQEKYIQDYIYNFETALNSQDFRDSQSGYRAYIDLLSFVDTFIINELTKDIDGYRFSTFMYKDKNGPLTMGPIWDYNLGFGNVDYGSEGAMDTDDWMYNKEGNRMYWWRRMMYDYNFKITLRDRWFELRRGSFSITNINRVIDSLTTYIDEAQIRNFERWPILGRYLWPNYFVGENYQEEIDYLKNWISDRLEWMDDNMPYNSNSTVPSEETEISQTGQSLPNPFVSSTVINFFLQNKGTVDLKIYDLLGRQVRSFSQNFLDAKEGHIIWDGKSDWGDNLSTGIYFFVIVQNNQIIHRGKLLKQQK